MFGWFDPVRRLEKRYARELEAAEKELARSGDRAKHAAMMTAAEKTGQELDALKAARSA